MDKPERESVARARFGKRVPNVQVVGAGQPAEAVRRESTTRIWEQYAGRWGARRRDAQAGVGLGP